MDLTFSRAMSAGSRPRTPPSIPRTSGSKPSTPPIYKSRSNPTSPPRRVYTDFLANTNGDWNAGDDEDDNVGDSYGYEDDNEDEFGLPSLASYRRKKAANQKGYDPGGIASASTYQDDSLGVKVPIGRQRANSSDIAEERGTPNYPTAKKSEGKILRPQYKEILRGQLLRFLYVPTYVAYAQFAPRSCKCLTSNTPSPTAPECYS